MLMSLSSVILYKLLGWHATDTLPQRSKAIICVAPHTSNWDFFIGQLYYRSLGRRAGFLMKKSWFFWPLGPIFRSMGGIPIERNKKQSTTDAIATAAQQTDKFLIAITPEGTRSRVTTWRRGFYYIALKAGLPIQCYAIDYKDKHIIGTLEITPSGDVEADLRRIMDYYRPVQGRHPQNFTVEEI